MFISSLLVWVQAIGTLGAVIMPHNLYLHSGLVKSRAIDRNNPCKLAEGNYYNTMEGGIALLVSYFINAAIVVPTPHCVSPLLPCSFFLFPPALTACHQVTFATSFFNPYCAELEDGPYGCVGTVAINKQSDPPDSHGNGCTLPSESVSLYTC